MRFCDVAKAAGYKRALRVCSKEGVKKAIDAFLEAADGEESENGAGAHLVEILLQPGTRSDIGRPKSTPVENRDLFQTKVRACL